MWNQWVHRIQQGIDEAVDLLHEDEDDIGPQKAPNERCEKAKAEPPATFRRAEFSPAKTTASGEPLSNVHFDSVKGVEEGTAILAADHNEVSITWAGGNRNAAPNDAVELPQPPPAVAVLSNSASRAENRERTCVDTAPAPHKEPASLSTSSGERGGGAAAQVVDSATQAQLLRFQEQLAEEMRGATQLSEENATLKEELRLKTEALATTQAKMARSVNLDEEIAMLIDKLGREKTRNKTMASERRSLCERLQDFEDLVEDFKAKELEWKQEQEAMQRAQSSTQEHVDDIESVLQRREAEVDKLKEELEEVTRTRSVLATQLSQAMETHNCAVEELKEHSSDATDFLEREVERLQMTLRRVTSEYDQRCGDLEADLHESNLRAHQAETRLSDVERSSVGSLQALRVALEDMQSRVSTITAELHTSQETCSELESKYTANQRARAADVQTYREQVFVQKRMVASLTTSKQELNVEVSILKSRLTETEQELEEAKRRCFALEASNAQLKVLATDSLAERRPEEAPHKSTGGPIRPARAAALPLVTPCVFGGDGRFESNNKTLSRLEKEIVRLTLEVERLKKDAQASEGVRQQLTELQAEHDLLLQMYGEQEEESRLAKESLATIQLQHEAQLDRDADRPTQQEATPPGS